MDRQGGGEKVYDFLKSIDCANKIIGVVDNDSMKQGLYFHNIIIISADELNNKLKKTKEAIIIIASGSAHIILRQLIDNGIDENIIFPFVFTNLQISPTPYEYFFENKKQIIKTFNILNDDKSKKVWVSLLNYKMTMDAKWLKDISDNEHLQYFDDIMALTDNESFVDCGAYIGDTLEEYNNLKHGKWNNYYCFEADPDIYKQLLSNTNKYNAVKTYNIGCWSRKSVLNFEKQGSGSSSIKEESSGTSISADALDNVLKDNIVTIIKMDIEGAEQEAIKGASNIINTQRPKLAISIYHSLEDFILIPYLLSQYNVNYKIYIRHYREITDSETICYAIAQ